MFASEWDQPWICNDRGLTIAVVNEAGFVVGKSILTIVKEILTTAGYNNVCVWFGELSTCSIKAKHADCVLH